MSEIINETLEKDRRERVLLATNQGYAALREDTTAWTALQEERAAWDATVMDGLIVYRRFCKMV